MAIFPCPSSRRRRVWLHVIIRTGHLGTHGCFRRKNSWFVTAGCVTVYVRPAIVNAPIRGDDDVFGCATKLTSPLPPVAADEIVSHGVAIGSVTVAVQPQTAGAITPTDPAAPAAGTEPFVDCSAYVHAVPACETLIV